jgi:hydrogenase maturation protein HypF
LSDVEARSLASPARPIVLARRRPGSALAPSIAPGLREVGVFLPYSPLQHLLLADLGAPVVATSGNLSGEPVLTDEVAARTHLGPVVDAILHHDRPIVRPADDSVVRCTLGAPRIVRSGRGLAPSKLALPSRSPATSVS